MITKQKASTLLLDSIRAFNKYNKNRFSSKDLASEIFIVAAKYIIENYHPNASSDSPYVFLDENTQKYNNVAEVFASALKDVYPSFLDQETINQIKENILLGIGVCQTSKFIEDYLLKKHGRSDNATSYKFYSYAFKRYKQGNLVEYSQDKRELILTLNNDKMELSLIIDPSLLIKKATLQRKNRKECVYVDEDLNYKIIVKYNQDDSKINSVVVVKDDIQIAIEYLLTNPLDYFINDIRSIRSEKENRVVCVLNDRGSKSKYVQVFNYGISDVINIYNQYREFKSIYKNWVLYECFNTFYKQDELILDSFLLLDSNQIDVIENENECWGAIMSCLILLDKIILNYHRSEQKPYPECVLRVLELYFDLVSIYLTYHRDVDSMRTAECHANRARVCDRYYYHDPDKACFAISRYTKDKLNVPVYLKFLFIYDMHMASRIMPSEFGLNYAFRMTASTMHQNRQVVIVDSEEETWDTNYDDILKIGEHLTQSGKEWAAQNLESTIHSFCDCKEDISQMFQTIYHDSVKLNSEWNNIKCLSHYLQIESYAKFGMVKPKFIPIHFKLNDFISKNKFYSNCVFNSPSSNSCRIITTITEFGINQKYEHRNNRIMSITLQCDEESNITDIMCYGLGLKALEHQINWTHMFMGIPVYIIESIYNRSPELVVMKVAFQQEYEPDINYIK